MWFLSSGGKSSSPAFSWVLRDCMELVLILYKCSGRMWCVVIVSKKSSSRSSVRAFQGKSWRRSSERESMKPNSLDHPCHLRTHHMEYIFHEYYLVATGQHSLPFNLLCKYSHALRQHNGDLSDSDRMLSRQREKVI